ncbi:ClpP protease [Thermus phage TMA]|uniref:ClpP protease n=1 Tax=Thermus phage TMA TaxID=699370 RepID=UPI00021AAE2B|nr:ClpP protease [Thermus phage TMA]BAK53713.1 ClpP protease [Thermus phage TMA]
MLHNRILNCGSEDQRPQSVIYDNFVEINFSADIDEFSVNEFVDSIYFVSHELSKFEVVKGDEFGIGLNKIPIIVQFSTFGGDVMQAMRAINLIKGLERDVIFVANSIIASAGVYIFLSAKESNRFVTSNSFFIMHDFLVNHPQPIGSKDIVENLDKQYKVLKTIFENEFIKKIGLKKKVIGKGAHKDIYITPEEAIKYNIASDFFKGKHKVFENFGFNYDEVKSMFYKFKMTIDN